jgi:predicted transcriptional regulator
MKRTGRPKNFENRQDIFVSLDAADVEALDRLAAEQDRSRAWLAGRIITDFLRRAVRFSDQSTNTNDADAELNTA